MKKSVVVLIGAALAVSAMTACGTNGSEKAPAAQSAEVSESRAAEEARSISAEEAAVMAKSTAAEENTTGVLGEIPAAENATAVIAEDPAAENTTTVIEEADNMAEELEESPDEVRESPAGEVTLSPEVAELVDYGESEIVAKEDIEKCAALAADLLTTWEVEIQNIRYAGDESITEENAKWLNSFTEPGKEFDQIMELTADFHVPDTTSTTFNPGSDYKDYQWWFGKYNGQWQIVQFGY